MSQISDFGEGHHSYIVIHNMFANCSGYLQTD